jgi:hypothetical protein
MKTKLTILFAACLASAHAQYFTDNFNGGSLNSSNWQSSVPFSDSGVTVSGGSVTLLNGGGILTVPTFSGTITVDFSFSFTGSTHDSFQLYTRADQFRPNGYASGHGVGVTFRIQEDNGNLLGNVALQNLTVDALATGTIALTTNTVYSARLVDTGTTVSLFWQGGLTPFLTANDSNVYGNKIVAFNREGAGNGSSISAGSSIALESISVVPEPGTWGLLAGLAGLGLAIAKRRGAKGT